MSRTGNRRVEKTTKQRKHGSSEYYRRKIKSMQPLTVRFGLNAIKKRTTLVTQNFCVDQIVFLFMMK